MSNKVISIRRHCNDASGRAEVFIKDLEDIQWCYISGGQKADSPQPFIHAYILCDKVDGELAHSGTLGPCPHRIKVCITKMDNPKLFTLVESLAGAKVRFSNFSINKLVKEALNPKPSSGL